MAFGGSPVASLFVEFGAETKGFDSGVDKVESGMGKAGSAIGGVLKVAGGFVVAQAGIAGFGAAVDSVVGQTMNFDTAMRELNVLAGMNDQEFKDFQSTVIGVSKNLGVDATQSVNALSTAIGSGVPQENLISFIENSTKAAIGGSADLQTVVAGSTGIIKAYGMEWESVNHVQDTFLQIADDGVTTVEELSRNMGGVAPIANAAGVSFEEMAAVYSTLTGVTGNTSEVTTQLKGALTSIIKPSAQASALASQMGLDFSTSAIESKGLAGFLQEVGQKAGDFAKDSGSSTVDVLGQLFGSVEGLNAVLALTGTSADQFGQNLENVNGSAGKVDGAFEEMNKSFGRQVDMIKAKLNGFALQIGTFILPLLFRFAAWFGGVLSKAMDAGRSALGTLMPVINLVRDGFLTFIQALSGDWADADGVHPLHSALGNVGLQIREVVIPAFHAVVGAVTSFVDMALPYVMRFGDWFLTVGLPAIINFGTTVRAWLIDIIVPAVSGFVAFVMPYLTTFADWFMGVALPAIITFAGQASAFFTGTLLPAIQTFVDSVLPRLQEFGAWIVAQIPTAQEMGRFLTEAFTQVGNVISTVIATAVPIIQALGNSILPIVQNIVPQLLSIWETLKSNFAASSPFIDSLRTLFDQLKPAIMAVAIVVGTVLVVAWATMLGGLSGAVGFLTGVLPGAFQAITGVINIVSGVLQVFSSLIIGIVKIVSALLHGEWGEAWNAAKEMVSGMASGVMLIIKGLVQTVTGLISGLVGGVLGLISGFIDGFLGFFKNLYHEIVGGSIIPDLVTGVIDWIGRLPGAVLGLIGDMVTGALGALGGFLTDALGKAGEIVSGITNKIAELITGVPGKLGEMAVAGLTALGTFVTDSVTKGTELVTQVTDKAAELITQVPAKVLEMGTNAVTEFGTFVTNAVAKVGELPGLAVSALSGIAGTLVSAGSDLIGGFIKGITDRIPDVAGALGGLTDNLTSWKGPPEKDATLLTESGHLIMSGFIAGLQDLFPETQLTLENFTEQFADTGVKAMAEAMLALFDATKAGVDALNSLVDFVGPSNESISAFKFAVEFAVRSLADTAAMFSVEALEHAKVFGDSAGPIVDMIAGGVEGLTSLAEFVRPADEAISEFKFSLEHLVRSIADSAAMFQAEGLTHAQLFAESAKPIVDLITASLDAFVALTTERATVYEDIPFNFAEVISWIVMAVEQAAQQFESEGLKHAKEFAEAGKPIMDLVASALDAFVALVTEREEVWEDAPANFVEVVSWVVAAVEEAAANFDIEGVQAAAEFAKAGGDILSLVGEGADLSHLADFEAPAQADVLRFVAFTSDLTGMLQDAASTFTTEGLEAASLYAGTAKSVLDIIGGASDFSALGDYSGAMIAGIDAFFSDVRIAIEKLVALGLELDSGLTEAVAIAEKVNAIVDLLTPDSSGNSSGGSSGGGSGSSGGGSGSSGGTGSVGVFGSGFTGKGTVIDSDGKPIPAGAVPLAAIPVGAFGSQGESSTHIYIDGEELTDRIVRKVVREMQRQGVS